MTSAQILALVNPTINSLFLIFLGWLGVKLAPVIPTIFAYGKAKLGATKEAALLAFGTKVFYRVEEDGRVGKLIKSKIDDFETYIVAKYPLITKAEIDTLRQAISGEFNKDKLASAKELDTLTASITDITKTVPVTVKTTIEYTDPATGEVIATKISSSADTSVSTNTNIPTDQTTSAIDNTASIEAQSTAAVV